MTIIASEQSLISNRRKKANTSIVKDPDQMYYCTSCGTELDRGDGKFYKNSYSRDYKSNDCYVHLCRKCTAEMFEEYKTKYGDQRLAVMIMCAKLDFPYYHSLYETVNAKNETFSFGMYTRQINNAQYKGKTFATTLAEGELERTVKESVEEAEEFWPIEERRAKNEVVKLMGHDPFLGYTAKDRRYLFTEFLHYLDDDELLADQYKVSQLIQLLNNNNQINEYDKAISKLDPVKHIDDLKLLSSLKKDLVVSNEKIAKENGFSVKSRGEQKSGRGTLTGLMRDMREKDLKEVESNFYDQLRSPASRWATDISMQSMLENIQLDENDVNDIVEMQREMVRKAQDENDVLKEEKRLLKIKEYELEDRIRQLEEQIVKLGGELDGETSSANDC